MKNFPAHYHNCCLFAQNIRICDMQGGGVTMNKKKQPSFLDHPKGAVQGNVPQEVLEISSTGYGLESVDNHVEEQKIDTNSCGGL